MNIAMILAGGTGSRFGASIPKQFLDVQGKPMLAYTIAIYERHPEIDAIEVACHADWIDYLKEMVEEQGFKKVRWISEGGASFQESVIKGIAYLDGKISDNDMVFIQYGDAPMTSAAVISDSIRVCKEHGNSSPAGSMLYLTCGRGDGSSSDEYLNRDNVMRLNTPQGLRFGYAKWLYEEAERRGLLETVDPHTVPLMLAMGERVWFSIDESINLKVTTPDDLLLFEGWVLANKEHGVDL